VHDLAEVVGDEPIILRVAVWFELGNLPPRQIAVDAVQEGNHLHEVRQRLKQLVILLVRELPLHVQVAYQHQTGEGQQFLLPTSAELCILHIPLHYADHRFGVGEVGVGDLVEDHGIPDAYLADLAIVQVDEELRRGGPAARQHAGVIRNVPVQVSLARLARGQFDHVDVGLDQRHAPRQVQQLLPPRQFLWVQATRIHQHIQPLFRRELLALLDKLIQVDDAHLERRERRYLEWANLLGLNLRLVVGQFNRAPHAAGQQHGVLADDTLRDVDEVLVDG